MRATYRQLQLFLALAEHGGVSAAARACHVTQPTVSMQLKDLADSVGLPLWEQIGKRLHLTAAGAALAEHARGMADEWAAFEQKIAGLKGLTQGRLRLAVVSTAESFVPEMLGTFCARHPAIEIALQVLNRDGVVARLRSNLDDLYIMSTPPADVELEQRAFLPNPLVVVAARSHPLVGRRPLPLARLAKERFILRELGSGTRMACDAHFAAIGFEPSVRLELGSNEAIKHAVAAGLGIAVLSRHALGAASSTKLVAELNVRGFPVHSNWFVLYPRGKQLSPIASEFLNHVGVAAAPVASR
jgi:LysR family transcriptional regulator, low CO2-responsive transcriptional regulator